MQAVNAFIRNTHQYRDGWSYLDNDQFVATVNLTPRKLVKDGSDSCEGGIYVQYARVPSNVNITRIKQALQDTMGGSNCRHDHDCCGCATRSVSVTHMGSRRLAVRTSVSYNY